MSARTNAAAIRYLRGPLPADRVGRVERAPRPASPMELIRMAGQLDGLASRIRRNVPLNSDPDKFHEEKSEITRDLSTIADELRGRG